MSKKANLPTMLETLGSKVDIAKKEKRILEIDDEIKNIHSLKEQDDRKKIDEIRTSIFLPKVVHRKIKIYCAKEDNISMKDFITNSILKAMSEIIID